MQDKICGRSYTRPQPGPSGRPKDKPKPRVIVDGINHPKGKPIRFKSIERAERHIRNMRLEYTD